ncbi:MAG TPA: DUF4124 domain-containing protein [Steroidobacteraceae bacterium]|nr:DUF4124 domain-containing protein [Steroidobacteraceae bacterium]
MRRYSLLTTVALTAGVLAVSARADIWKWVDSDGHVHYSDRWTQGAILIKADHPASNGDDQKTLAATSQQISQQLHKDAVVRSVKQDEAAQRAQECKDAQDRYAKAIHARRIYTTDDSGNRQYLSDDEAEQARIQAKMDVDKYCGSDSE